MERSEIKLKMSSSRHPKTDGTPATINRMVENYIYGYISCHQDDWDKLLPGAEFACNSSTPHDIFISPLQLDLGWVVKTPLDIKSDNEVLSLKIERFSGKTEKIFERSSAITKTCKHSVSLRIIVETKAIFI